MPTFHCEWAWFGGSAAERDVAVEIEGDRIVARTAGVPAPPGAARLSGLTIPGMHNAHSHAFHRALRGRTQVGPGDFFTWREQMYTVAQRLTPDTYLALARATYAEMLLAGITSVTEFHYVHHQPDGRPYGDPNAMSAALCEAARQAGIRLELLDTCYLHLGLARFRDASVDAWAERAAARRATGGLVTLGAAVHSVRAVTPPEITRVVACSHDTVLHAHVSEQPAENAWCRERYGRTPTEVLADAGALSHRFTAVHGTHVTDGDVTLLNDSGSTVCVCPTTERDLADGIGPVSAFARLSLGTDSHAVIDLLEEARGLEMHVRLRTGRRGTFTAARLAAIAGSGTPDGRADLVTIRLDSPRTAGAADPLTTTLFAATAADVTDVVVAGEHVVRDARHVALDVAGELDAAIRAVTEVEG